MMKYSELKNKRRNKNEKRKQTRNLRDSDRKI